MTKRVFLVDDEVDMTQLVGALLKFKGYSLQSSNDPEAALATLLVEDFDVVVMDLMMPRLDGLAMLEILRSKGRNMPVIVLSAKSLEDDERKAVLAHHARFVPKPISPTRIVQIVQEAAAGSSVH
ncbi:MAG: response regulator [Elusimicrobia bacterium]|nr:response regulator [Elusimicrobiota bacterium]